MLFFELEAVYLAMWVFAMVIAAIVTTREFMPQGAFKKGMLWVSGLFALLIATHYQLTTHRMETVEALFQQNKTIICENKMHRTVAQSILVNQSQGWQLHTHLFQHPDIERSFLSARCVEWLGD